MAKQEGCYQMVYKSGNPWHPYYCKNPVTVVEPDGKKWCASHSPEGTKAREAVRKDRYTAESGMRQARHSLCSAAAAFDKDPANLAAQEALRDAASAYAKAAEVARAAGVKSAAWY